MAKLEGIVERITYYNEENFYTVARLQCQGKDYLTTVVGKMPGLTVGESIRVYGEWLNHPDYGYQFRVNHYETMVPATLNGIEKYLGSGLIKGIGPVTARKLVRHFGLETLEVIENQPYRLTEVDGIGEVKAAAITRAFLEQKEIREVMMFLQVYGVSPTYAIKIYRHYGNTAIKTIQENPFRLADDIFGIGFKTADRIAQQLGVAPDSAYRIAAGLQYVLSQCSNEGHVYVPRGELIDKAAGMLGVPVEAVEQGIEQLRREEKIFIQVWPDGDEDVYLAPFFYAERGVASRLLSLAEHQLDLLALDLEDEFAALEREHGLSLAPAQKEAVAKMLNNGVMVLTGGPGTGKTTTIRAMIEILYRQGLQVCLAAPTGRAAKRMAEATGCEAKTIHRLLEYGFADGGGGMQFQRNETNPLKADAVIVDEVSMVDILLMYNLLKAIRPGTRLVLVGDADQLPSVGPGSVLKDLLRSRCIAAVQLTEIFRQARESMIVVNAHRINKGEYPLLSQRSNDFFFLEEEDPEKILNHIVTLCTQRLPAYNQANPLEDIQVLTPMRRTLLGVDSLNAALQEALNPPSPLKGEIKSGGIVFRLGDKVMQIKNNYEKGVFNGDIGYVEGLDFEEGEIIVRYPDVHGDREVRYARQEFDELVLAYSISVHKSQGSEYPIVVMPLTTQHYMMLQRNLLYTAITRAAKMVVLVGTKKALGIAVRNNRVQNRYSRLAERIYQLAGGVDGV